MNAYRVKCKVPPINHNYNITNISKLNTKEGIVYASAMSVKEWIASIRLVKYYREWYRMTDSSAHSEDVKAVVLFFRLSGREKPI